MAISKKQSDYDYEERLNREEELHRRIQHASMQKAAAMQNAQIGYGQQGQNVYDTFRLSPNLASEVSINHAGCLLWKGAPLPENWRGAQYDKFTRTITHGHWEVRFTSEWATESVYLYLDVEKYSGEQVNAMATTFLDAINQRRTG